MKANEFVKKFGWDVAIKLSNEMTGITQDVADCVACWGQSEWDCLKRLVASYDTVQRHETGSYSALENAKQHVLTLAHMEEYEKMYALEKAIADVESCQ